MIVYIVHETVSKEIAGTFATRERAVIYLGAIMSLHREEVYECFKKKLPLPKRFYEIIEEHVL